MAPSNRRFRPHCHLKLPIQRTPANLRITLYCYKLRSLAYIFAADSMGLCSFVFSWWAPKKHMCHVKKRAMAAQGQFKVTDLGTNRYRVLGFLLVFNSNFGRILQRFGDMGPYRSKNRKKNATPLSQIALTGGDPLLIFRRIIAHQRPISMGYQTVKKS